MLVLICGSRHCWNDALVFDELDAFHRRTLHRGGITGVVSGMAKGVDTLAAFYAWTRGLELLPFPADWERYGKGAGPIRNKQMLVEGRPDEVVAFVFPNSRGTADMVKQSKRAGFTVTEVFCQLPEDPTQGLGAFME